MSVPDTLRMDLADPRICNEITLDRRQALSLVNEVDSLRDQVKEGQSEIDRLKIIIRDVESIANEMSRNLYEAREQRDQLLAQLERLWNAVLEDDEVTKVMNDVYDMISKMKNP